MLLAAALIIIMPLALAWGVCWLILCPFWYLGRALVRYHRDHR